MHGPGIIVAHIAHRDRGWEQVFCRGEDKLRGDWGGYVGEYYRMAKGEVGGDPHWRR